jgi:hypothetical protein
MKPLPESPGTPGPAAVAEDEVGGALRTVGEGHDARMDLGTVVSRRDCGIFKQSNSVPRASLTPTETGELLRNGTA